MFPESREQQLRQSNRQLIRITILEAPAMALLGLALYAKFFADGDAFHPLLNDATFINGLFVLGGLLLLMSAKQFIDWVKTRKELEAQTRR